MEESKTSLEVKSRTTQPPNEGVADNEDDLESYSEDSLTAPNLNLINTSSLPAYRTQLKEIAPKKFSTCPPSLAVDLTKKSSTSQSCDESISEHIPSFEETESASLNIDHASEKSNEIQDVSKLAKSPEQNVHVPGGKAENKKSPECSKRDSSISEYDPSRPESKQSSSKVDISWPKVGGKSDIVHISNESSVQTLFELSAQSQSRKLANIVHEPTVPVPDEYPDSLTCDPSHTIIIESPSKKDASSSSSDEIIKLDIRGQAAPKFYTFPADRIIIGPPPKVDPSSYIKMGDNVTKEPKISTLMSQFALGPIGDTKDEKQNLPVDDRKGYNDNVQEELFYDSINAGHIKNDEADCLIEELVVDNTAESENLQKDLDTEHLSIHTQSKSLLDRETPSLSTMTTDYKTICEEYYGKLMQFEAAMSQKDELIKELTISLQQSNTIREELQIDNEHLTSEVGKLQVLLAESVASDNSNVQGQLSDYLKYETLVKGDDTRYFSAFTSRKKSFDHSSQRGSLNSEKDIDVEEMTIDFSKASSKSSYDAPPLAQMEAQLTSLMNELHDYITKDGAGALNSLKDKIIALCQAEVKQIRLVAETEYKALQKRYSDDKQAHNVEVGKMRNLLSSMKTDNINLNEVRNELNISHEKEMENLRTYYEKICSDMKKNYSEEVFSQHSLQQLSPGSSADSLDRCPAALPFGSPLHSGGGDRLHRRSKSVDFQAQAVEIAQLEVKIKQLHQQYQQQMDALKAEHVAYVNDLVSRHKEAIVEMEEAFRDQIAELKAHIQTAENTEDPNATINIYEEDIDLELEKGVQANLFEEKLHEAKQDVILHMQEQIQALLSDPNADLNSWPLDLVALRDKLHTDAQQTIQHMKIMHEEELSSLRAEHARQLASVAEEGPACGLQAAEHWRRRRNDSFDENRRLEEITKQRDGFKERTSTLQRLVQLLVNYLVQCEDEVNNTILEELLKLPLAAGVNLDVTNVGSDEQDSKNPSLNTSLTAGNSNAEADPNMSVISSSQSKRVHFAPDVQGFLSQLNDESIINCLEQEKNLSLEIKNELDVSLKRLRQEAQELLALSLKVSANRNLTVTDEKKAEESHQSNGDEMRRLVEEMENTKRDCDICEMEKKQLEETIAESLHREILLREQLEQAMVRIAELMNDEDHNNSREIITEGYGTALPARTPVSLPPPSRMPIASPPAIIVESRSVSLDGSTASAVRRAVDVTRLNAELENVVRARDDLQMQLEAANRQLKSTRQFVDEQTSEREHERDEYARELKQLRDENSKLLTKLQHNGRIRNEVDQLEAHMREMTLALTELEAKKSESDAAVVASNEKISILQEVIANLEGQLELKSNSETEILAELCEMRRTIDLRDSKMRELLQELESLKSEQAERTEMENVSGKDNSLIEVESSNKVMDQMREQLSSLEESIHKRTITLERIHEAVCSQSCSSPSEDVSIRDQKIKSTSSGSSARDICVDAIPKMPILSSPARSVPMAELSRLAEYLQLHFRAEDAALKRIRDLEMQLVQVKDVAQELRTERDVLQERMSEQALKISSLQMRLDEQRHCAEALRQESTSQLAARLHDTLNELQNTREILESKEKQVGRLKALVEETKRRLGERDLNEIYIGGNAGSNPMAGLERELQEAQNKNRELYQLAESIDATKTADIQQLKVLLAEKERQLVEKEEQLQGLLALKLDDENAKENSKTEKEGDGGKISARTLSDIVSISEYDEQDLQMRRAELKPLAANISGTPISHHDNKEVNKTLPPEIGEKPHMRSLHLDNSSFNVEHLDLAQPSPGPYSAPLVGSPQVQDQSMVNKYKRNVNETLMFGSSVERLGLGGDDIRHSTAHGIADNCSMYPNKDVDESKDNTVEPKKINFSIKSDDSAKKPEHKSLKELGITIDLKQEQYPDILTQLKHEILTLRAELDKKTSALNEAQDKISEFPTVNRELEELKNMLQSSISTMKQEKQFYEKQLEDFAANKQLLEEQLASALNQANEKTKDLQLLKEDILRRENMVLELAKEKRILQNQLTEFEVKCQTLLKKNAALESYENENIELREKLVELKKLEQLISEKNLQIDSLNEHLDRLDNLQRCLDDKAEEIEKLTDIIDEKAAEILQLQENERLTAMEIGKITENNRQLKVHNDELVERLTKFEKEQENLKQKANMLSEKEKQLEKISTINSELTAKLEEMKSLTDKLKDKECEIEILNEDINTFHEEIASLKEQLKLASRSPSPRDAKVADERTKTPSDKQSANDKKQLSKIRKQVSLLQSELNYNKKDLNERVFELERTKLEVIELRNELGHARKRAAEQEGVLTQALKEGEMLRARLQQVLGRLQEEANLEEIQEKLKKKTEECVALERELELLRDALDRMRVSTPTHGPLAILAPGDEVALIRSGQRSPTEELEERVRRELQYARQLDESIMDQILSGGSNSSKSERNLVEMVDDEEEVPPLELHSSRSNSSLRSSASEKFVALQRENDQLRAQLSALETRLADKEALVGELAEDARAARLKLDAEKDNSGRLQLLLETQRQCADDVQTQDVNVIQILRNRLEGAMETESELQQALEKERLKAHQLQLQLNTVKRTPPTSADSQQDRGNVQLLKMQLENQVDANERLKSETMLLKAKLDREKSKLNDTRSELDKEKRWFQRELEARTDQLTALRSELAELKRLKHEAGVELVHAREAVHVQKKEIANLEKRIAGLTEGSRGDAKPFQSVMIEFEQQKGDLSKEISSLKKALELANQREMNLHQFLLSSESSSKMTETLGLLKEEKGILKEENAALKEEKAVLRERIRLLEQDLTVLKSQKTSENGKNQIEEYERGIRYLHACLLRVESHRKALIWQKRYLLKVQAGYLEVEQTYAPTVRSRTCKGKQRFRCIAFMIITVLRLGFLVRRRHNTKIFSANCLIGKEDGEARKTAGIQISNSPPMRDKSHRAGPFTPNSLFRQTSTTPSTVYKEWQRVPRSTPLRNKTLISEEKSREGSLPWRNKNLEEISREVMESQSPTPSASSSCRNTELRRRTGGNRSSRSSTTTCGDEGSNVRSSATEQESTAVLTQLSRRLDHYSLRVSHTLDTHHHAP